MKPSAICCALALTCLAGAQQSVAAQATVPMWREVTVYATDGAYPAELAQRGVQGEATVELALGQRDRAAAVRESSRSAELDALALVMAKRLDIAGAPGTSGLVRIKFVRDHSTTLATKSCADFNADAAYQTATFPERSLREMPAMVEGVNMLVYSLHSAGQPRTFPAMDAVMNATVAACARAPGSGMLDVMRQETLKLIGR